MTETVSVKPNPFISSSTIVPKEVNPLTAVTPSANEVSNPFLNPAQTTDGN